MPSSSKSTFEPLVRAHWALPDERLIGLMGWAGYLGTTVGSAHRAPHVPLGPVARTSLGEPDWPLPTRAVAEGRFCADEWAHDPAIWAWAHAAGPDAIALGCADHLAAGPGETWVVLSSRRLAVLVETRFVTERPVVDLGPPAARGLLGRARTLRQQVVDRFDAGDPTGGPSVTCWWERPLDAVREFRAVPAGRVPGQPEWFFRVAFTDGSALDVRMPDAEKFLPVVLRNLPAR